MFTRISSITLSVMMLVLLGSQVSNQSNGGTKLYVIATCVVILIFAAFAINFKRLNFTWPHLLLPTLYLLGVSSVFVIIPDIKIQVVFLILASIVFYFLEMKLGRESHFLQNIFLLSAFGLFLSLFAMQFYFNLRVWWVVPAFFILSYGLAIQGFAGFSLPSKKYFYLLVAVVIAEASWGLSFWPTHFFVNAVILFCFFYLLWLFSFSAFFGKLTRQKIYWQLTLIVIVLILTLSTAAWRTLR